MNTYIRGLHHIAILSAERERSIRFYQTLGFEITATHLRPERQDEIIMMTGYGILLELFAAASHPQRVTDPEAYGLRHLALAVSDLEGVVRVLKDAGYQPEPVRKDSFTGEKMTFVKDPDGLPVELHE